MRNGIEGGGVLTEALAIIESEERDVAGGALDQGAADNGAILVVDEVDHANDFGGGHFAFIHVGSPVAFSLFGQP
jgi:hypothetical protein